MTDCGELIGSTHRCGECGEETYAVDDLVRLYEEFDACDWPDKGVEAYLDWLRVRAGIPQLDELPANVIPLRPDLGDE